MMMVVSWGLWSWSWTINDNNDKYGNVRDNYINNNYDNYGCCEAMVIVLNKKENTKSSFLKNLQRF